MKPTEAAVEAASKAQWDYEVAELIVNGEFPTWDYLPEFDREKQRNNVRFTLQVAYDTQFGKEESQ